MDWVGVSPNAMAEIQKNNKLRVIYVEYFIMGKQVVLRFTILEDPILQNGIILMIMSWFRKREFIIL